MRQIRPSDIAASRTHKNRFSRTHRGFLGEPEEIDQVAVLGEVAFCHEFNLPRDEIVDDRGPRKVRIQLADGTRVKVYTTKAEMLAIAPKYLEEGNFDAYVLARVDPKTNKARLVGWATPEMVRNAHLYKLGERKTARPSHNLSPRALLAIEELKRRHFAQTLSLF